MPAAECPRLPRSVLHTTVADLIDNTNRDQWRELATRTGLSFSWIVAFANDRVEHPSAARLECLYTALTGKAFTIGA